jgi:hypothetical protein
VAEVGVTLCVCLCALTPRMHACMHANLLFLCYKPAHSRAHAQSHSHASTFHRIHDVDSSQPLFRVALWHPQDSLQFALAPANDSSHKLTCCFTSQAALRHKTVHYPHWGSLNHFSAHKCSHFYVSRVSPRYASGGEQRLADIWPSVSAAADVLMKDVFAHVFACKCGW